MIWLQGLLSFLVWILYGWRMRSASASLRDRLIGWPRKRRVLVASLGLTGSLVLLFLSLWCIAALGGMRETGLTAWGWIAVTLAGLGFIHVQVISAASMITLLHSSVTPASTGSSVHQDRNTS